MINKVPFLPMKLETAKRYSRPFLPIVPLLIHFFPALDSQLLQLEEETSLTQYISVAITTAMFNLIVSFLTLLLLSFLLLPTTFYTMAQYIIIGAIMFSMFSFLQVIYYPRLLLSRKSKALNRDLLFALRHILIQLNSGVPLYESMISVSNAGYDVVSKEFEKTVKEINSGESQTAALEAMLIRTPSKFLRRAIWQISNALKAGSDLVPVLEALVNDFSEEQRVKIQQFGKELSPWALMYLLLTVIFPTMGVALIMILSSFTGAEIRASFMFSLTAVFVIIQFFFIKFIKSKRPSVRL